MSSANCFSGPPHLLDALLGALVQTQGLPGYTVRLDLRFLRPIRLDRPVRVEGVMGIRTGSKMQAQESISQYGESTVEATALFIEPPDGSPPIE